MKYSTSLIITNNFDFEIKKCWSKALFNKNLLSVFRNCARLFYFFTERVSKVAVLSYVIIFCSRINSPKVMAAYNFILDLDPVKKTILKNVAVKISGYQVNLRK